MSIHTWQYIRVYKQTDVSLCKCVYKQFTFAGSKDHKIKDALADKLPHSYMLTFAGSGEYTIKDAQAHKFTHSYMLTFADSGD